jgi:hypothetical protein
VSARTGLSSRSGGERHAGERVLGPGGAVDERAVDRRHLGMLAARYGALPEPRPLAPEELALRALLARRSRAMAAADPELIRYIERHERSGAQRVTDLARFSRVTDELEALLHSVRPASERLKLRDIGEERELESSELIQDALQHRTPQAFLRDLHRPVQNFGRVRLHRTRSPTAGARLAEGHATVREALAREARSIGAIRRASQAGREGIDELRAILARPWGDSRPENPLPMPRRGPTVEDMHWFGLSGGYDPDL